MKSEKKESPKEYSNNMLQSVVKFFSYWWFRYLMVTELYMVEKWERVTIHVIFALLFCLAWYFNYSVLLSLTGKLFSIAPITYSNMMDPVLK